MELRVLLMAVLAFTTASTSTSAKVIKQQLKESEPKNFDDLWRQFLDFIPFNKEVELIDRYLATDQDVQTAINYLFSETFASLVEKVDNTPLWPQFLKFLYDSGVEEIYTYINQIHEILKLPPYTPPATRVMRSREDSGVLRMFNEMLRLLPREDISTWFEQVCNPDPVFQFFLSRMRSPEFSQLTDEIISNPDTKEFKAALLQYGMDTEALENAIVDFVINGRK